MGISFYAVEGVYSHTTCRKICFYGIYLNAVEGVYGYFFLSFYAVEGVYSHATCTKVFYGYFNGVQSIAPFMKSLFYGY